MSVAQAAVWDHLRRSRSDGLATLLISADLDELIGLSDTIVVMFRGKLVATLDPNDVTPRGSRRLHDRRSSRRRTHHTHNQSGGATMTHPTIRRIVLTVGAPISAVFFAVLLSSLFLLISGSSPFQAYIDMIENASRLETFVDILNEATPLYISAIAAAIGFRMNLFNIGVEGQYLLAAFFAAAVGGYFAGLPPVLPCNTDPDCVGPCRCRLRRSRWRSQGDARHQRSDQHDHAELHSCRRHHRLAHSRMGRRTRVPPTPAPPR